MLRAICIFLLSVISANAEQQCTEAAMYRAESDAVKVKTWDAAYRWIKLYSKCDFVAAEEGFADSVGRLLVDHWPQLTRAAALIRKDPKFRSVVVHAASEMLELKDLELIKKKARSNCPRGLLVLCADIANNADVTTH
jgi:hypothetical protein